MADKAPREDRHKEGYQKLLDNLKGQLPDSEHLGGKQFRSWLEKSVAYAQAAGDMTKDELELIASYIRRDISSFADSYQKNTEAFKESPTYQALESGFWHWLLELTDKTQCEWHEIAEDLKHEGTYHSGEMVGLGTLICDRCGNQVTIIHPQVLGSCPECNCDKFIRAPLEP